MSEITGFEGSCIRCFKKELRIAALKAELAAKDAEIERLMDMVRYVRQELFDERLISPEEYAALVADSQNGTKVARLDGYDNIIAARASASASRLST